MANAELISDGQERIIIATVYRDDYVLALRAMTREGRPAGLIRMLDRAQDFVSRIDFETWIEHSLFSDQRTPSPSPAKRAWFCLNPVTVL